MTLRSAVVSLLLAAFCGAQHEWQAPKPLVTRASLEEIIGPQRDDATPSRDLNIVWVWGYDGAHRPGAHDYLRVRDLMVGLLAKVPRVTAETAYLFPTEEQLDRADLVAMYLHLPQLTAAQYARFERYVGDGGGVIALHETAIMRPAAEGKKLGQCLGMSWDEGRSQWGAIFEPISIDHRHPIFAGFASRLRVVDEFYWELNQSEDVEVIGEVRTGPPGHSSGPVPSEQLSKEPSPVFWTLERGEGRVFGTTAGHNTFTYHDPEFRVVLFRAVAWVMAEDPAPFLPLVFDGIVNDEGMVGTTDDMRSWKGKLRAPPKD